MTFVISGTAVVVAAAVAVIAFLVGYARGFERCRRAMHEGLDRQSLARIVRTNSSAT
jgi:flagellar biosynthesis/type III secretory pathway M-ring protein FliF/YscJ